MPEVATEIPNSAMTLRIPWRDAAEQIHAHLKIGRAIKNQRIRDQWELDHARAEKAEWIRRTTELLKQTFIEEELAEESAQYAPPVLPEYAEFDLFVDQFEDEMRHRLDVLQQVLKQLDTLPETSPSVSGSVRAGPPNEPAIVEIELDGPVTVMEDDMSTVLNEALGLHEGEEKRFPTADEKHGTTAASPASPTPTQQRTSRGLLILATTDEAARKSVGAFLRELDFKIEVIDRAAAPGRSVAEMLGPDQQASFAVLLADASEIKQDSSNWEFELGFCAGRLGAGRVFVASATSEAMPDRHGIRHLAIDSNGGWQLQMARHLKRAGVAVDLNRLC